MHPRTRGNIERFGLKSLVEPSRWLLLDPLPNFDMIGLMRDARLVRTNSGGVQEKTTMLGVPCLTLR